MAMKFIDGFDYLTFGNINLKWDNTGPTSLGTGVYGKGKCVNLNFSGSVVKTLGSNITTGMIGCNWFFSTIGPLTLLRFLDAASVQVDLRTDATGAFFFTRNGTAIGSTSSFRVTANNWYWIEIQTTIDPSAGVANLYVNQNSILSQSGLNTRNTANSFFNQVAFVASASTPNQVDNFHFWDTTAGDVSSYPYGEHIIDTELANAVGSNTTWTKGGTTINANNYQQVNEANEDGDTTYVTSVTPNQIDSYGFASLSVSTGTIGTIAVNTIDRIDDVGPHVFDHFVKSSSATALSAGISPSATYTNHQSFFGTDPNTSAAWTVAGRNAAEFGYKEIS